MDTNRQIICCDCGHTEQGPEGTKDEVHFPARLVYTPLDAMPWKCPTCGNSQDVVLFGQNEIQAWMRLDTSVLRLPHVIASNEAYAARKAAEVAQPRPTYSDKDRQGRMPRTKTGRLRGPYGSQKFYRQG